VGLLKGCRNDCLLQSLCRHLIPVSASLRLLSCILRHRREVIGRLGARHCDPRSCFLFKPARSFSDLYTLFLSCPSLFIVTNLKRLVIIQVHDPVRRPSRFAQHLIPLRLYAFRTPAQLSYNTTSLPIATLFITLLKFSRHLNEELTIRRGFSHGLFNFPSCRMVRILIDP